MLNPSTGKLALLGDARYRGTTSTAGDCYVKTEKNSKFKGYAPWHTSEQGVSYVNDWLNQLYSVSDARFLANDNLNRINSFFVSPHTWPWDGTSNFEGNTGQVVYEWSMNYKRHHKFYFEDAAQIRGFCATALGVCSKPW